MSVDLESTIVALSSAPGPGARAIVRLTGPKVMEILKPVFSSDTDLSLIRRRWTGTLTLPNLGLIPADLYLWVGPASFTGQHLAELHLISSPPLVELLISELLRHGATAAQPGEMTMRGFLNGKLDLTRAEAVLGVIEAGTRSELTDALRQLAGGIAEPLQVVRDDLLNLLADVEAGLDFVDEDITFVGQDEMLNRVSAALAQVITLSKQMDDRSRSDHPFRVVLAGRPNAGKSSLFNALSGGRALVSEESGTTRDYLVQRLDLPGAIVDLVDTAGREQATNSIEAQSQSLGKEQTEKADLVLLCVEAGQSLTVEDAALMAQDQLPVQLVSTKCDLGTAADESFATSVVNQQGIQALQDLIVDKATELAAPAMAPGLSRCRHHLRSCVDQLRRAHAVVLYEDPPEILAMELRGSLDQLGEMVGAVYTDDLLDRIFSRFCIGK